jgi:hypothetical protein
MSGIFENVRDALRLFPPPRNPGLPGFRGGGNKKSARELRLGVAA